MSYTAEVLQDELTSLKERANVMGIPFSPNIGVDALRKKVEAAIKPAEPVAPVVEKSAADQLRERNERMRRDASKLVRVRIQCMNPNKKEWQGEFFTVSNSVTGTLKKFVPYTGEYPTHVPQMILNVIQERKCQIFVKQKDGKGNKTVRGKLIPEFSIEILDPLTAAELDELKQQQLATGRIED